MFNQQEIQILLGGVNAPIDLDDLRSHTGYGGLYDDNEATIVAFWNVSQTTLSPLDNDRQILTPPPLTLLFCRLGR